MAVVWLMLVHFLVLQMSNGAKVNSALNKPVNMSSVYQNMTAKNGVDGDIRTVRPYIIHTDVNQSSAWWMVDLQTVVQDATVKIYFRTNNRGRRNGVQLYTSTTPFESTPGGQLCDTVLGRPNGTDIPDIISLDCSVPWRYLMLYTRKNNGEGIILDFAEVEVLACSLNTDYGSDCNVSCGDRRCKLSTSPCRVSDGECVGGCLSGWDGIDCTQKCVTGLYGENCEKICGDRHCVTSSDTCHHVTAACPFGSCQPANCLKSCSDRQCRTPSSTCDPETGQCPDKCLDGWTGQDCSNPCPNGKYGVNCVENCGYCNGTCDVVNGRCPGGCLEGYTGTQCRNKLAVAADGFTELDPLTPLVTGALIGAGAMLVVMVGVFCGLFICLMKCGRLKWVSPAERTTNQQGYTVIADVTWE